MTLITMSAKELDKFQIIKRLLTKHINGTEASKLLRLSVRQVRRLKAKVRQKGVRGLIHGNRGQMGHNRIPEPERKQIVFLLHRHYYDFKPTFASEKLSEKHHLIYDPKTIRQVMIDEGLWQPRSKRMAQTHRLWRERKSAYGEMIQFDGSYEHWFEDRNGTGKICLLAAIDDATGKIVKARFVEHEGVFPVFDFWEEYLRQHGKPMAVYLDKFSTYNQNQPLAKENFDTLTQFERAAQELRVELIKANSPQAKGRVERLFGTLQDRLIKELRLQNVADIEPGNKFLVKKFIPNFNARFAAAPRSSADLHRPLTERECKRLPAILSRQSERTVQNDYTFSFKNQWHQLLPTPGVVVCKKDTVIIEERLGHSLHIRLRGKYLNYRLLPLRPRRTLTKQPWALATATTIIHEPRRPAPNHPWRLAARAAYAQRITLK